MSTIEFIFHYYILSVWNYKPFDIVLPRYIMGGAPIFIGIYPIRILLFILIFIALFIFLRKYKFNFEIKKK